MSVPFKNKSSCRASTPQKSLRFVFYFIRFMAGLATTVTSNKRIKENISNIKKAIKKTNRRIRLKRIINVTNVRLIEENTEQFIRHNFGLNRISFMLFPYPKLVKKICRQAIIPLFLLRKSQLIGYLPAILIIIFKKLRDGYQGYYHCLRQAGFS